MQQYDYKLLKNSFYFSLYCDGIHNNIMLKDRRQRGGGGGVRVFNSLPPPVQRINNVNVFTNIKEI